MRRKGGEYKLQEPRNSSGHHVQGPACGGVEKTAKLMEKKRCMSEGGKTCKGQ